MIFIQTVLFWPKDQQNHDYYRKMDGIEDNHVRENNTDPETWTFFFAFFCIWSQILKNRHGSRRWEGHNNGRMLSKYSMFMYENVTTNHFVLYN